MVRTEVGRIAEAWVYPVKGMQGVKMDEVSVRSISVVGDRRVAFTEIDGKGTPTLLDTTKFPGLLRYSPRFEDPLNPRGSDIIVKTPEGIEYPVNSPRLLEQISEDSKRKLTILRMGRGAYHSMPVSLMSLGTVKETDSQIGSAVDHRVYRQNLYIETLFEIPYEEEGWIEKLLIFGDEPDSAKLVAVKLDPRCETVNYHPETGLSNPNVLKAIVKYHDNYLGIYCAIVGEGKIQSGAPVYVTSLPGI